MSTKTAGSPPKTPAWRVFFPLAALHAAVMVPLSLLAFYHGAPLELIDSPAAHGRELLFGFALAVIAGYLLGPLPPRRLWGLVALWLAARGGGLVWPEVLPVLLADGLFALLLAWRLVPRFLAAKKWRNRLLSPLLGLLCLLAVATLVGRLTQPGVPASLLVQNAVLWLMLLMTFMGGRVLAPAINGHLMASRREVGAGVQPRLEAALIILLVAAPLLAPWPATTGLAAPLTAAAGLLVLWRLWRWRPWACRRRPDLLGLMLGYAWLGAGLLLAARVLWLGLPLNAVLHAFTVGALGTLASGIMLRQAILRAKGRPEREPMLPLLALLFGVAAVLRLLAFLVGGTWLSLLWASALAWSVAWLLAAWRLVVWSRRGPIRHRS